MIKKIKIFQLFILFASLMISCKFQHPASQKAEEAKIVSLFIDEMAVPFPLPSMPSEENLQKSIKKTNWDSIKRVATTIVVDTIFFSTHERFELPPEVDDFQDLVDTIGKLNSQPFKKEEIESEEGHELIFGDSIEDFQGDYPQMVYFSRIAFNNDFSRAAVYAGYSSGKLSGYLNLYLLEKKKGRWIIKFKNNIEKS